MGKVKKCRNCKHCEVYYHDGGRYHSCENTKSPFNRAGGVEPWNTCWEFEEKVKNEKTKTV